ncbi:hypothetical protein P389DRAFT_94276 [Cystobasidium minutum MCA 4210]|uniref:uncharacterized protein n=1 Tax=Cystobasidium minutum MCA 4210 TaxID=1397322 RepID=UPI0034CD5E2B|eukprot:jgi/Rhomi1/94276/CE94275_824
MPSMSLISMLSIFTVLLSLLSLMNASPIAPEVAGSAAGLTTGSHGNNMKMIKARSSLDITEHSTGSTYDCAPRDIHCCEQALGHSTDKSNKGSQSGDSGNGSGSSSGSGSGGSGSGSGSNVARRSPASNNPFDNVLRMRDVVGNFGVNCSPIAIGAISTCKAAVMCCSDMTSEGKVNAACTPLGIA